MAKHILSERLRQLPRRDDETWQGAWVDLFAMMPALDSEVDLGQMWSPVWVSRDTQAPWLDPELSAETPGDAQMFLDQMVRFAEDRQFGGYRPARVEVADAETAEQVRPLLEDAEIEVAVRESLEGIEAVRQRLAERLPELVSQLPELADMESMPDLPDDIQPAEGLLSVDGVDESAVRAFAEAARRFFEAAPWQELGPEDLLEVDLPNVCEALRRALVLGEGAEEFGLTFYPDQASFENFEDLAAVGPGSPQFAEMIAEVQPISVLLHEPGITPSEDIKTWQSLGLALIDEQYPVPMRYAGPGVTERPDAEELRQITLILAALAASRPERMDEGEWTVSVEVGDLRETVTFRLPHVPHPEAHGRGGMPQMLFERFYAYVDQVMSDQPDLTPEQMNEILGEHVGKSRIEDLPLRLDTPEMEAQELAWQAADATGRRQRRLIERALALDPDCVDALNLRAVAIADPEGRAAAYQRALEAGERKLGEAMMDDPETGWWDDWRTRPYMRALQGLAEAHEYDEDLDAVVPVYQRMLEMNPTDNQGVRYRLLGLHLFRLELEEAADLLERYKGDEAITWDYGRAIHAYLSEGDTAHARQLLRKAHRRNPEMRRVIQAVHEHQPLSPPASDEQWTLRQDAADAFDPLRDALMLNKTLRSWVLHNAKEATPEQKRRRTKSGGRKGKRKGKSK